MTLDTIALWLGYGVMIVASITALAVMVFLAAWCLATFYNRGLAALIKIHGLQVLRKTMRQLEAEGKVSKKSEVNHG